MEGFNTRRYTSVCGFCFFKLFPTGCIGLKLVKLVPALAHCVPTRNNKGGMLWTDDMAGSCD